MVVGYGSAFHLKYLQDQLKEDDRNESVTRVQHYPPTVLIKWDGNNNQLYDVIRQLKKRGLIISSYADLAIFLKKNIDKLEHTALSTIQKELERGQRPTKARRVNLDLES